MAEVEVDMKTGYVDVLEVTASHDVGTAINPALVKGQIYGGIVMGQGFAVTEDVVTGKRGQKTKNFDSYILPTSMDAPKMNINIYENQDPAGTYGANHRGTSHRGRGAAIANAIFNATGRRVYENPADLETVLLGHKLQ
ncbi:MAG: molybdopterin cofactor-binding domain-containing protein [Enterocloster clostridioformis]